jgi:CubicO group peptidase (beta-lactamase class C family)
MTSNMPMTLNRRAILRQGLRGSAAAAALLYGGPMALAAQKLGPGGFSPERLKDVTTAMQGFVDRGELGGVVTLLYRKGEIPQVNALGWQDPKAKIPMARDSIFRIASMTKPITTVAALMLWEEGKYDLDTPIDRWLPELANRKVLRDPADPLDSGKPASRPISVLDLMTHRAGIGNPRTKPGPLHTAIKYADDNNMAGGWDEWLKRVGELPLAYEPGSTFHYGNNMDVLGMLVQRVTGQYYPDFLRERIFKPLGMNDTDMFVPADKMKRHAALQHLGRVPAYTIPPADKIPGFVSAAAGLFSTADDYLQFAKMLLGGGKTGDLRLLRRRTVDYMSTNYLTPEQRKASTFGSSGTYWVGQGFGLGVAVKDDLKEMAADMGVGSPGTFGWPGVFGTWYSVDPKEQMIPIFMVPGGEGFRAARWAFQAAAYKAIDD